MLLPDLYCKYLNSEFEFILEITYCLFNMSENLIILIFKIKHKFQQHNLSRVDTLVRHQCMLLLN